MSTWAQLFASGQADQAQIQSGEADTSAPACSTAATDPGNLRDAREQHRQQLLKQALLSRADAVTGERRCRGCGRGFLDISRLAQHVADKHSGINSPPPPEDNTGYTRDGGARARFSLGDVWVQKGAGPRQQQQSSGTGRELQRTNVPVPTGLANSKKINRVEASVRTAAAAAVNKSGATDNTKTNKQEWPTKQLKPVSSNPSTLLAPSTESTQLQGHLKSSSIIKERGFGFIEPVTGARPKGKKKKRLTKLKKGFHRAAAAAAVEKWLEVLGQLESALQAVAENIGSLMNRLQPLEVVKNSNGTASIVDKALHPNTRQAVETSVEQDQAEPVVVADVATSSWAEKVAGIRSTQDTSNIESTTKATADGSRFVGVVSAEEIELQVLQQQLWIEQDRQSQLLSVYASARHRLSKAQDVLAPPPNPLPLLAETETSVDTIQMIKGKVEQNSPRKPETEADMVGDETGLDSATLQDESSLLVPVSNSTSSTNATTTSSGNSHIDEEDATKERRIVPSEEISSFSELSESSSDGSFGLQWTNTLLDWTHGMKTQAQQPQHSRSTVTNKNQGASKQQQQQKQQQEASKAIAPKQDKTKSSLAHPVDQAKPEAEGVAINQNTDVIPPLEIKEKAGGTKQIIVPVALRDVSQLPCELDPQREQQPQEKKAPGIDQAAAAASTSVLSTVGAVNTDLEQQEASPLPLLGVYNNKQGLNGRVGDWLEETTKDITRSEGGVNNNTDPFLLPPPLGELPLVVEEPSCSNSTTAIAIQGNSTNLQVKNTTVESGIVLRPGEQRCACCGVVVSGQRNWEEHLASKRHAAGMKRAINSSPEPLELPLPLSCKQPKHQPREDHHNAQGSTDTGNNVNLDRDHNDEASSKDKDKVMQSKEGVDNLAVVQKRYIGIGADVEVYVDQIITPEINAAAEDLLKKLLSWQERARQANPMNAKKKKRLVSGMREVQKAARLGKAKLLIAAPNVGTTIFPPPEPPTTSGSKQQVQEKGEGLETLASISSLAHEERDDFQKEEQEQELSPMADIVASACLKQVPVVFALSRQRMGKILGARKKASAFAVLDASGAEQEVKVLLGLMEEGRREWAAWRTTQH